MSGPYSDAVKSFAQSMGNQPFPDIYGLIANVLLNLQLSIYPTIHDYQPFYGQDVRTPEAVEWIKMPAGAKPENGVFQTTLNVKDKVEDAVWQKASPFEGGTFHLLNDFLKYQGIRQSGTALNHYFDAYVCFCGDSWVFFDHPDEAVPPRAWQWSWERSYELFDQKYKGVDYDKRPEWKCWKLMPATFYKEYPEGSGGLDDHGNPQ